MLPNTGSRAWCTVRPNKLKHQSSEQCKVYYRAMHGDGWLVLKNPELPDGFGGKNFIGKIWGEGHRVCDFPLIGQWWGNRTVLQKSCAQPEVNILHLGGGFSSCRRTQRYPYVYYLRRNQDPAPRLYYCFLTAPLLSLFSLPSLINNCLNLSFGSQGRSRRLNGAYFLKMRNGGHRKDLYQRRPYRVLLGFNSLCVWRIWE